MMDGVTFVTVSIKFSFLVSRLCTRVSFVPSCRGTRRMKFDCIKIITIIMKPEEFGDSLIKNEFKSDREQTDEFTIVEPNAKKTTLSLKLFASNADECTTKNTGKLKIYLAKIYSDP